MTVALFLSRHTISRIVWSNLTFKKDGKCLRVKRSSRSFYTFDKLRNLAFETAGYEGKSLKNQKGRSEQDVAEKRRRGESILKEDKEEWEVYMAMKRKSGVAWAAKERKQWKTCMHQARTDWEFQDVTKEVKREQTWDSWQQTGDTSQSGVSTVFPSGIRERKISPAE